MIRSKNLTLKSKNIAMNLSKMSRSHRIRKGVVLIVRRIQSKICYKRFPIYTLNTLKRL